MTDYLKSINRAIILIILSDVFAWGLYAVLSILTGLYLSQRLDADITAVMGLGIFIYFITRAVVNFPAGKIMDLLPGHQDEAAALLLGSVLMGVPFVFYPLITTPYLYYILQVVFGIGAALHLVSSRKIFATSLDKNREAEEYSLYDIVICTFIAIAGLIAGVLAGISPTVFSYVFVGFGLLIISSGIWAIVFLRVYYPERKPLFRLTVDFLMTSIKYIFGK